MNEWIDVCCGGGGLSFAIQQSCGTVVTAIDNDSNFVEVYKANFPGVNCIESDIKLVDFRKYRGLNLAVSFPCGILTSKLRGDKYRVSCFELSNEIERILNEMQPESFIIENLPVWIKTPAFRKTYEYVNRHKYNYWYTRNRGILTDGINYASYGIPQNRVRFIFMGSRHLFRVPTATYGNQFEGYAYPYKTWFDAIVDEIPNFHEVELTKNQCSRFIKRVHEKAKKSGIDLTQFLLINQCSRSYIHPMDVPAPTLVYKHSQQFKLIKDNIICNLNDAALLKLQTFPESYKYKSRDNLAKILGNSSPPDGVKQFIAALKV